MKKISRKDLQGLRRQYPALTKEEMKHYVGGYNGNSYFGGGLGYDWGDGYNDFGDLGSYWGGSSDNYYNNDAFYDWLASGNYFYDRYGNFFWSSGNYFIDPYGNPFWYGDSGYGGYFGGDNYGMYGNGITGNYVKTNCVAHTIAFTLHLPLNEVSAWIESHYGKNGVPGNKYYEVLNHFFEGSPTPIPPYEYNSFGENSGPPLLAAIKIPNSIDGHSVFVTKIKGAEVQYIDAQNNNVGTCTTFDLIYLYRVDGHK